MTNEHALFLKIFNPCSDRVDAIQQLLQSSLNEQAARELIDHVETCKHCRRYQGYLESVENGFKNLPADISEISPVAARELPTALQEEMAQAMKRNLSRWLLESVRGVMYRQKLFDRFFLDESELQSLSLSLKQTQALCTSLKNMNGISPDDLSLFPEVEIFVQNSSIPQNVIAVQDIVSGLKVCITLHTSLKPYDYYHQLYVVQNKLDKAEKVNLEALNASSTAEQIGRVQNHLGGLAHRAGELDKAVEYYQQSLEKVSLPVSNINLALAYLDLNRGSDALVYIKNGFNVIDRISDLRLRGRFNNFCTSLLSSHYNEFNKVICSNKTLNNLTISIIGNEIK